MAGMRLQKTHSKHTMRAKGKTRGDKKANALHAGRKKSMR